MNIIKTNESHFLLWCKQFVISHEDSIIVDFHLCHAYYRKEKETSESQIEFGLLFEFCTPSNGTACFI